MQPVIFFGFFSRTDAALSLVAHCLTGQEYVGAEHFEPLTAAAADVSMQSLPNVALFPLYASVVFSRS